MDAGVTTRLSRLDRSLRGDLETIAHTALAQDPARRCRSAAELRADVFRFLASSPVAARPAEATYRLRKFCTRHRGLVLAPAVIVLAVTAGLAGTLVALGSGAGG